MAKNDEHKGETPSDGRGTRIPHNVSIIDGLLYDFHRKKVITPNHSCLKDCNDLLPEGLKKRYAEWNKLDNGTIIEHECPNIYGIARSMPFSIKYVQNNKGEQMIIKNRQNSKPRVNLIRIVYPDRTSIFIYSKVPKEDQVPNIEYQPDEVDEYKVQFLALESVYNMPYFKKRFMKFLPDFSINFEFELYQVEINDILDFSLQYFNQNDDLDFSFTEKGTVVDSTDIYNSLIHIKRFYYFLLNIEKLSWLRLNVNVFQKITRLKSLLGNHRDEQNNINNQALVEKTILFREIIVSILENSCEDMFIGPVLAVILLDEHQYGNSTEIVVLDAHYLMLKYILISTIDENPKMIPREYLKAFYGENKYPLITILSVVYKNLCIANTKRNLKIGIANDGVVLIDDSPFSKAFISSFYEKVKSQYLEALQSLQRYGLYTQSIDDCFELMLPNYRDVLLKPIYGRFTNSHIPLESVSMHRVKVQNVQNIMKLLNSISKAITDLIILTQCSTLKIRNLYDFDITSTDVEFGLKTMADEETYLYIKNNKNSTKYFINCEVTKYFVHFILSILPIKLKVLEKFSKNDETFINDQQTLKEFIFSRLNFNEGVASVKKVISFTMISNDPKYSYRKLHEAYSVYAEKCSRIYANYIASRLRTCREKNKKKIIDHNNSIDDNEFSAFNDYASTFKENSNYLNDDTVDSFNLMKMMNSMLGLEGETYYNDICDLSPSIPKVVINSNDVMKSKRSLYPTLNFRPYQEFMLGKVTDAHSTMIEAPSRFGSFTLSTIILKIFNKKYPELVNVFLVARSLLKRTVFKRLENLQFVVGDLSTLKSGFLINKFNNVYVGTYEDLEESGLNGSRTNLGFLFITDCHVILKERTFRKSLANLLRFRLDMFHRIFLRSHTLSSYSAETLSSFLGLEKPVNYSDLFYDLPRNRQTVCMRRLNYKKLASSCYKLFTMLLDKYLAQYENRKIVVFFEKKELMDTVFKKYKRALTISKSFPIQEQQRILSNFNNDFDEPILMADNIDLNGVGLKNIALVVYYNFIPERLVFFQNMRLISTEGLVLALTGNKGSVDHMITDAKRRRINCNGLPDNKVLRNMYNTMLKQYEANDRSSSELNSSEKPLDDESDDEPVVKREAEPLDYEFNFTKEANYSDDSLSAKNSDSEYSDNNSENEVFNINGKINQRINDELGLGLGAELTNFVSNNVTNAGLTNKKIRKNDESNNFSDVLTSKRSLVETDNSPKKRKKGNDCVIT